MGWHHQPVTFVDLETRWNRFGFSGKSNWDTSGTSMVQTKRSIGLAALPWNGCHFGHLRIVGRGKSVVLIFFFPRGEKRWLKGARVDLDGCCFVLKGRGFLKYWSFLASAPLRFFLSWIVCSGRRVEVSLGELFWCKPMIEMIQSWETYAAWHPKYRILLLMEGILHHLGCVKPCKSWDKLPINWCRILSINSMIVDKWIFCRSCTLCNVVLVVRYSVCVCVTFTYTLTLAVWPFPIPDPPHLVAPLLDDRMDASGIVQNA